MLNIYSVYDKIADKFSAPVFTEKIDNHNLAIRAIKAQMYDNNSMIAMFPDNYYLYYIGSFDETDATIETLDDPDLVINCQDALKELREERKHEIQE